MSDHIDIDIDALINEGKPRVLKYRSVEFSLPGELPGAVLAPFLNPELGIAQIIADAIAQAQADEKKAEEAGEAPEEKDGPGWLGTIVKSIGQRPDLPLDLIAAAGEALKELFEAGAEGQYTTLAGLRPSVAAYLAIGSQVAVTYGVGLMDFFSSSESQEDGGDESKLTSPGSTPASTPALSGAVPLTAA